MTMHDSDAMPTLPREKRRGKQKIDIGYLQNQTARKQTFRKRNLGLFKKAMELAKLCGATVALRVALDEPKGKSYEFYYYSWKPESENRFPTQCSDRATSNFQQQQAVEVAPAATAEFCHNLMGSTQAVAAVLAEATAAGSSSDFSSGTTEMESQVTHKSMNMGLSCLDPSNDIAEFDPDEYLVDEPTNETSWPLWDSC